MTIILSNEDAEELLPMSACITALEEAYCELAHGRAANPIRSDAVTPTSRDDAVYSLKSMGGVIPSLGIAALRLNSDIISFGTKRQVKLPLAPGNRYTGLVLLFSVETGEPLAIFPDGVLQHMRVGATSALAAKYLAREDASTVGLIGAGWQAGAQVAAITEVRKIRRIQCYSPTVERRNAFCASMSAKTGVEVVPVGSSDAAAKDADIMLCATNTSQHVLFPGQIRPGMHIGTIRGAELHPDVVRRSDVVVIHERSVRGAMVMTHGIEMPKTRHAIEGIDDLDVRPTIAQLVAGMAAGRASPEQVTCFLNLTGIGLQFAAVGAAFYRRAVEAGRGRELPTEWFTEDVVP
jgi:alanine dehydrogenase